MIFFALISAFSFSDKGKPVAMIANKKVYSEDIPEHLTLEQHLQNLIFFELAKEKGYDDSVKTRIDRNLNQQIVKTAITSYIKNFSNPTFYERMVYYKLSRKKLNIQMIQTQSFLKALQAYIAVKSGKDFGEVSKEYSFNPEIKHVKGVYPYPIHLTPKLPPPFIGIFAMKKGEISLPIKNGATWNIFKITDIKYQNEENIFDEEKMLSAINNPAFKKETASYNATIQQNKIFGKFIPWIANIKFNSKNLSLLSEKISKVKQKPLPIKSAFLDEELERTLAESAVGEYKINSLLTDVLEVRELTVLQNEASIKNFIQRQIFNDIIIAICKRTGVQRESSMEENHKKALMDATIDFFKNKEMLSTVKETEEDLKEFYNNNPDKYVVAAKRKVYLIEVKEEKEALEIRSKLTSGGDFESIAKEVSIGRRNKNGGDIGYIKENQYENIGRVAFELKKGQISKPFETENGWAIIKVTDIKKSYKQDYKDVKATIRNDYKVYKAQQIGNQIYEQNKENYKLKILS